MVNFGNKLKELRLRSSMTQSDLANRLGVSKSVVSYYELQERSPSPEIIIRLSEIFHVTTDYLLGAERNRVIDVSDLKDDDIKLVLTVVEALRKKNAEK